MSVDEDVNKKIKSNWLSTAIRHNDKLFKESQVTLLPSSLPIRVYVENNLQSP